MQAKYGVTRLPGVTSPSNRRACRRAWRVLAFVLSLAGRSPAADPTFLGKYPSSGSSPNLFYGVALSGGEVFAVTYGYTNANGALRVLVGNSPPGQVRATGMIDGFRKVEVGSAACAMWSYYGAGNWRSGIRIFNKSTLAEYDTNDRLFWIGTHAQGIDLAGNTLYVASDDGLIIVDVTDPDVEAGEPTSGPHILGIYTNVTTGYDVDVAGGLAFVADGTAGLKIIDVSSPAAPSLVGAWLPGGGKSIRGVSVGVGAGGATVAYVVGEGFWTVDVAVPSAPVTLGAVSDEDADRVVAAGGFAYVAGSGGLRAYGVTNLSLPVFDGRYMTPNRAEDVVYAAPFIYLADRSGLIALRHGAAAAMELTLTADPEVGRAPLDVRLTADVTGGTPDYSYDWFIDNVLVYSGEESFLDHTFDAAEIHVVRVTATDASAKVASAATTVDARGPRPRLYGTVRTADTGTPIGNASVTVQGPGGVLAAADTVNPAGEYSFGNLRAEIYRVTASAPDYQAASQVVALSQGQNRRADFGLSAVLTDSAKEKKGKLITELSQFPEGARDWEVGDVIQWIAAGGTPSSPVLAHPYADTEQITAAWVAQQTNLTEALQRITLAEGAFNVMSEDAAIYANYAAEYYADAMGNTLDLMICLFQLNKLIEGKFWFSDVQGMLIKKYTDALSLKLFSRLAKWTGEKATLAARTMFKESMYEIIGVMAEEAEIDLNVNQFVLDWKARFENYWVQTLLDEYGRTTEPLLTYALDRATDGPPYGLAYEDSKAIVLAELRATAAKRESVVRHQTNIDQYEEIGVGSFVTVMSWLNSVLDTCGEYAPEAGLAHVTELALRSQQIYAQMGNTQLALDRLRGGLPQEAANAVYESFGETPPVFPPTGGVLSVSAPAIQQRLPGAGSGGAGPAALSLPVPSSQAARDALAVAHGQLAATNLAAYAATLTNAVIPAVATYLHDAGVFHTAAGFQLPAESTELEELDLQLDGCSDGYQFLLAASLELLMNDAAGNPPTAPGAAALRQKLLDRITTLIASLGQADSALNAVDLAAEAQPAPGPVLAITGLSAANAEGVPLIPPTAGQTLGVSAEVFNVGSTNASGVQISLILRTGSILSLAGGAFTVALPPLAAGASTNVAWTLTNSVAGCKRFEMLSCALSHSGSDHTTALPAGESFLVVAGPYYVDADGDGIADAFESENGLNPGNTADGGSDADMDTLSALSEFLGNTNPNSPDTDGDGYGDLVEIDAGFNPFDPGSRPVPAPPANELEVGVFDVFGSPTPLLIGRFLKPDPAIPITVQGSTNLFAWSDVLVYSNSASVTNPAVLDYAEYAGHYELLFATPGFEPDPPRAAFYRLRWDDTNPPPSGPVRITLNPGNDVTPKWHPTGETIAFATYREPYPNDSNLGLVESDGDNEHLAASSVIKDPGYGLVRSLAWAAVTGGIIVEERVYIHEFLEFHVAQDGFRRTIWDGRDDGFSPKLRISSGALAVCTSRDGSTVLWRQYPVDANNYVQLRHALYSSLPVDPPTASLWTVSHGTRLLMLPPSSGDSLTSGMALNSDGSVAVISMKNGAGRDLYLYWTDGSNPPTSITSSGGSAGAVNQWPEFSPDNSKIAFDYVAPGATRSDLAIINADGTGFHLVTDTPDVSESAPTWSPDGGRLAFQRYDDAGSGALQPGESPNWSIYVVVVP